jgi:hypothetical protein
MARQPGAGGAMSYSHRVTQADSPGSLGNGLPGADGQLPGQLPFPGMEPESAGEPGQRLLPGMEEAPRPAGAAGDDPERDQVAEALRVADPGCARMAAAIRGAFDLLLDGQHTGRYRWDQLHKTENLVPKPEPVGGAMGWVRNWHDHVFNGAYS